jgi:hypothetical protein
VELRDGEFIRKARAQGYGNIPIGELIDLRVQGKVKA